MKTTSPPITQAKQAVFFFDIDNCLYPRNKGIWKLTATLIKNYMVENNFVLTQQEANNLALQYDRDYGLAIEGLVRHHNVDPLEFNSKVDDALPLDEILSPDPALCELLQSFDRSKVKLWLFTNAYVNHGKRVVKLLGIENQFEGITFCDYGAVSQGGKLACKPDPEMFRRAERDAVVEQDTPVYFIDDSGQNCSAAEKRGWITVQKLEPDEELEWRVMTRRSIRSFEELRGIFPHLFKEQET